MDLQLSAAYHEATELRSALETLVHDITGNWPLPTATPRDMAEAIRAAVTRERNATAAGQRSLFGSEDAS